jgi:hypothetical protein
MILATLTAAILRLVGPELGDVHVEVVLELPTGPRCFVPLARMPYDCPERVRWALTAIADRELPQSNTDGVRWFGIHRGDSVHEADLWTLGHRRGRKGFSEGALSWWCPAHADPIGMSTAGPHGMIYAFNVHRLRAPGNCVPWWIFAAPKISAIAARDRYLEHCGRPERARSSWCPSPRAVLAARNRRQATN